MAPNEPEESFDMEIRKKEASENFVNATNSFFSGGIDLIKWTVTIITAAIIWLSSRSLQQPIPYSLQYALLFFVASIFFALCVVIFVQLYWANQMNKFGAMIELYYSKEYCDLFKLPTTIQQQDAIRSFGEASRQIKLQDIFHNPKYYIWIVGLHIGCLLLALMCLVGYILNVSL